MSEWIRHLGDCVPVSAGTKVEVMYLSGRQKVVVTIGPAPQYERPAMSKWLWGINGNDGLWPDDQIIAYRLPDNGEQAKRVSRIEMLRKMAQPNDYDVRPVKAPERERVKQ